MMLATALVFGAVLVTPYTSLDPGASRLAVPGGPYFALLATHVFTALVALVLGPLQFVPAVRARRRVHRVIGRCYLLAGVLPSALAAVPVALLSGRLVTQVGLTVPAVLWLVTGWLAYRAAARRDFVRHREWMMRNYALTFLAVTSRIVVPLLLVSQLPFGVPAGSLGTLAPSMIPVGQVLGWVINLIVAEILIRRGR
ncbi:membrane protein, putative [[Actinomadura] parvosata subsp. kistnae]|nr:membrane protein, putative [Actinomadura parvosata subsp. kistnae]